MKPMHTNHFQADDRLVLSSAYRQHRQPKGDRLTIEADDIRPPPPLSSAKESLLRNGFGIRLTMLTMLTIDLNFFRKPA